MSYDVYLRSEKCPACGHYGPEPDKLDPTYNLTPIFHLALTGEEIPNGNITEFEAVVLRKEVDKPRGLRVLNGKTGKESAEMLSDALRRMRGEALHAKFIELEPDNGWGDLPGSIRVIERMLGYAMDYPNNVWFIQ